MCNLRVSAWGRPESMCGIAGVYAYHYAANPIDVDELRRIRDHMAARGPDGAGLWSSEDHRVGLANRRLAIIDLSENGSQPMVSADGKVIVTFNGEIYNYRDLRRELEARGHVFRTQTDTEVLLHLYAAKGTAMVHDLRGMFAFGLWDTEKRGLLLARDPYGIKPLYYADDGWTLRFASQVKALIAGGQVSTDPEPAGWAGFLLFGSVPEPFTVYQDVRAVPAGTTIWVDALGPGEPLRYFSIAEVFQRAERRVASEAPDLEARVRAAVRDSVAHHLVADVPVGLFLSAGIDSGSLLGVMRDLGHEKTHTITIAFEEFSGRRDDEAPLAAEVARHYGSKHTTRVVPEAEFRGDLPRIFEAMDQPTIDGINTWFVSKAARELGLKAALSGLGSDELFGGYSSFRDIPRWVRWLWAPSRVPLLGTLFRQVCVASRGLSVPIHPKTAGLLAYARNYPGAYLLKRGLFMPWELGRIMDKQFVAEGLRRLDPLKLIARSMNPAPHSAFGKVAALEASLYLRNQLLRDTDWASMAHSLEVRVPFVDAQLLEEVAPTVVKLREFRGKSFVARCPTKAPPPTIIDRVKTGFGTPIDSWLQRDDRVQAWRDVPQLVGSKCPWARRWAYQLAAA
jgi:asparagine synthase (glutamine-hydrolysing)